MSKQNEILATIETFLKDRNGENFQVSLEFYLLIQVIQAVSELFFHHHQVHLQVHPALQMEDPARSVRPHRHFYTYLQIL